MQTAPAVLEVIATEGASKLAQSAKPKLPKAVTPETVLLVDAEVVVV